MIKSKYIEIRKKINFNISHRQLVADQILNIMLGSLSYVFWSFAGPVRYLSILSSAVFFFRNFSIMHEASHNSLAKSKTLNDFCGILAGAFSLLPFEPWKQSHLTHHYWSGNLEKDPVMAIALAYPKLPLVARKLMDFFWGLWLPALALLQFGLFWTLCLKHNLKKTNRLSFLSVVGALSIWFLLGFFSPPGFMLHSVLPAIGLYLVFVEIVNFPHHLQMTLVMGEHRFAVWEQYHTARTCVYPKWFAHFVVLNFNYHSAHHVFPDLPWYRLPEVHELLKAELAGNLKEDPYFKWNIENRRFSLARAVATTEDTAFAQKKADS